MRHLFNDRILSAAAVPAIAALTGVQAAQGMNAVQWAGGVLAVLASITWAAIIHAGPPRAAE